MKRILSSFAAACLAMTTQAQNPYLPLWEHVPDGEPRVFDDPDRPGHQRIYVIGSHDVDYKAYCGPDNRMWSAPVEDLSQWRDEGPVFSYYVNGQWDTMYAPDIVETTDRETGKKTYWLYPHSRGWRRTGMVCKGDRHTGPFTPVNLNADGTACLEGSLIDFDPSVFVEPITDKKDKDYEKGYRAYVFYGFMHSTAFELDPDNMWAVRPGTEVHDNFLPAGNRNGEVRNPEITSYPALYAGQNPADFKFFEASSIRQVGNKYVMVFSGFSGSEYGLDNSNSTLRYAYGDSPLGPWRSGGVLVDSRGVVPNEDGSRLTTSNFGHNTHGSLQQINGQWYVFYHRPPRGYGYARQSMVAPVQIKWDKKAVADGGKVTITAYDPYTKTHEWKATANDGNTYTGAEVTSEGFQIFGLNPYQYYSAGIACYLNDNNAMQDNYDQWNNSMDLAGLKNGAIVGFKYFGFGGLARDTKGIKAFAGTKKGDDTRINLDLTPTTSQPFIIHVLLDGPYANTTWQGKEIAQLEVKDLQKDQRTTVGIKVPQVEGLTGKHAIYLVVEGPDVKQPEQPQWSNSKSSHSPTPGLFTLHGIYFASNTVNPTPPIVPQVTITADGQALNLPSQPIFFTHENGYTEANRYQVYGKLTDKSVLRATATSPDVDIHISPITEGRATITCTYQGRQKIYLIN